MNSSNGNQSNGNNIGEQADKIRVVVVDDQKMIREGLKALIKTEPDIEVVGSADNGEDGILLVEEVQPDIVLMDMEMPGMDGVTATSIICEKFPEVKILVLSTFDTQEYVSHSLSSGAMGYLLKGTPAKELTNAIRSVHLGYAQIGPGIYQNLPLISKGEESKIPATANSLNGKQVIDSNNKIESSRGKLVATAKGIGDTSASALALKQQQSTLSNRKFEQTVILRQSPKWSRATVWAVAGVTIFAIGWSAIAKIEQVVPAQGALEPKGAVKEVQVPTNGVVEEVKVEDGDKVNKGDVLLVLDGTTSKAQVDSLGNIRKSLTQENKFYRALMSGKIPNNEVDTAIAQLSIPQEVAYIARNRAQLKSENELYRAQLGIGSGGTLNPSQRYRLDQARAERGSRTEAARLEVQQLQKQLNQNRVQLADARKQLATNRLVLAEIESRNRKAIRQAKDSLAIEEKTLASIAPLVDDGAIARLQLDRQQQQVNDRRANIIESEARGKIEYDNQQQQVVSTQADIQRLLEEEQRLNLDIRQAREQLTNTSSGSNRETLDRIANNDQRIADIDSQLNRAIIQNDNRIQELNSQIASAEQIQKYQEVKAPVSGTVFDNQAYPGYVPPAGQAAQPILKIVPDDKLVAEVFIRPEDIGFVKPGMATDVKISAFPSSEFGDIKGELLSIGKDTLEPNQLYNFYRFPAKVALNEQYINIRGEEKPLQPGMSVQANIRVRENRTVMSLFAEKFFTGLDKFKEVK